MDQTTGWTFEKVQELARLAREGLPASTISLKLKRPIEAVRAKLRELGLSTPAG